MLGIGGGRSRWDDLPVGLRDAVGRALGSPVVSAVSQAGGFSPGSADRVRTAGGARAFVKAADGERFGVSAGLHRREAEVLSLLPTGLPVPALLAVVEEGGWLALVTEDVKGRSPVLPWRRDELDAVLTALADVAARVLPGPLARALPAAEHHLGADFDGFARLARGYLPPAGDDSRPGLDPWAVAHLDELADLARRGAAALAGEQLVHVDVRADNLLVRPDGGVVLVDWPHAARGAAWFDLLALLLNVRLSQQTLPRSRRCDVDALLAEHAPDAAAADVTAALAGLTGFFLDGARLPPPVGLPRLRAFQAAQGEVGLAWLRERWPG